MLLVVKVLFHITIIVDNNSELLHWFLYGRGTSSADVVAVVRLPLYYDHNSFSCIIRVLLGLV